MLGFRFVDEHLDGASEIGADQYITTTLLVLLHQRIGLIVLQLDGMLEIQIKMGKSYKCIISPYRVKFHPVPV